MPDEQTVAEGWQAKIGPASDVIAGSFGCWTQTFTIGESGFATSGKIRVHTDTDSDWGTPQFDRPDMAEYMSVIQPEDASVAVQSTGVKSLQLINFGRPLVAGEEIGVVYGDQSFGGPGSRAQTFVEKHRYFLTEVDSTGTGDFSPLAEQPFVTIVGDVVCQLVLLGPSTAVVGQPFSVLIKAEDQWGNPVHSYRGMIELTATGIEISQPQSTLVSDNNGALWIDGLTATKPGIVNITATDANANFTAQSNPIQITELAPEFHLNWADPHGGQLVSNKKICDFFAYARDVSGIQFVGYQRNADVIFKDDWVEQQKQEIAFYEPGRFVPIPGFEWSGRTPQGGHHNVYFRRHNQKVRRNSPAETPKSVEQKTELRHVLEVYKEFRNADLIMTPHVGGEHSNIKWHEPMLEPAVEMSSTHGSFEWMQRDALQRGYKLGFLGGSDSYTARPGDDKPGYQLRRYAKAGLTGIYTNDITIEGFHAAMKAKRVFATTGARIIVHVAADGHLMGSEFMTSTAPTVAANVVGTSGLESFELFRGLEKIATCPLESSVVEKRIRVQWNGSSRMTSYSGILWDGTVSVTGGKIKDLSTVRFDSPRCKVVEKSENSVRFHAWGCGYPQGLHLDLEGDANTLITVRLGTQTLCSPFFGGHGDDSPRRLAYAPAEGAVLMARLADLKTGSRELPLGVLDRVISISQSQEAIQTSANFSFYDETPIPGINPYWVKVVQDDGEMAWTSPVFVDYVEPTVV